MNKKRCGIIALIASILLLCSCSIPFKVPEGGIYFCEELRMTIDFDIMQYDSLCTELVTENGEVIRAHCLIDYGKGVWITSSIEPGTMYLCGELDYGRDGIFKITTEDGITYSFLPSAEE